MSYRLIFTKNSVKDIKKLDVVIKKKIRKKIEIYSKSPIKFARKLLNSKIGNYR